MLGHVEAPQYIVCLEKAVVAFFNHSFLLIGCPSQLKDLTAGGWGFYLHPELCTWHDHIRDICAPQYKDIENKKQNVSI